MANGGNKGDFIDFIMEATKNQELATNFLKETTPKALHAFFKKERYDDITQEDCERILDAVKSGMGKGINPKRQPIECDGWTQSY